MTDTATATKAPQAIATRGSIKVEPLTCTIGAELSNVNLGVASRDAELIAEIRALLLKHKVLFFRDQEITRAEHVAFARHFGELEDHPVAGSDPDNPGLVRIYKSPDAPADRYENAWHTDATWRESARWHECGGSDAGSAHSGGGRPRRPRACHTALCTWCRRAPTLPTTRP